jgi:transglutaminase-like putative cysteine protease
MTMRVVARVVLRGPREILAALEEHVRRAVRDLDASRLPPIYKAGIKYSARDPEERWQLPSETFARRRGDCEDLAVWRAAELRVRGEHARVVVRRTGPHVLHAVVMRADGTIEDPSKRLGMR